MPPTRQQLAAVQAYRLGIARRDFGRARRDRVLTVDVRDVHVHDRDRRAYLATREPIGDSSYRLGRLPTADQQAAGIDPRDEE